MTYEVNGSASVSNPVTNQTAVMVRQTASGFEQGVAVFAGFFTAGPLGALASWGALRGLQGKWAPWFILGVPAAVTINIINLFALGLIGASLPEEDTGYSNTQKLGVSEIVAPGSANTIN